MNELIAPELSQLPALPIEEVKHTVDKVGAYVDALAAAKKAVTDQNTINEIDEQIRKYSAFKIRCQMELGERTAKMEKAKNQHDVLVRGSDKQTKEQQLTSLGISKQRASENERMNANSEIVEHYLKKAEEKKEVPTSSGALREITLRKLPKNPVREMERKAEERHEEFDPSAKTVSFDDIRQDKEDRVTIGRRAYIEICNSVKALDAYALLKNESVKAIPDALEKTKLEHFRMMLMRASGDITKILVLMEGKA